MLPSFPSTVSLSYQLTLQMLQARDPASSLCPLIEMESNPNNDK